MKNQEKQKMVTLPTVEVEDEILSDFFEANGFNEQIEEILENPEFEVFFRNTVQLIRRQLKEILNVSKKEFDEFFSEEDLKEELIEEMKMLAIEEATRSFFRGEQTDMFEAIEEALNEDLAIKLLEAEKKLCIKKIYRIKLRRDFDDMIRSTEIR